MVTAMAEEKPPQENEQSSNGGEVDISETTAPSIGPNTVIKHEDAEERLARHEQSDTDAMGLEKRREVIGGRYSASLGRQAAMYGIVIAVTAVLAIGFIMLAGKLDEAPEQYEDQAPWSQSDAPQRPAAALE